MFNKKSYTVSAIIAILIIVVSAGIYISYKSQLQKIPSVLSDNEVPFVKNTIQDPEESGSVISYTGQVVVSGDYSVDNQTGGEEDLFSGILCFNVDEQSSSKIPRIDGDERSPWFCFNNQNEAKRELNIDNSKNVCTVSGHAQIVIQDYDEFMTASEGSDSTKLKQVISLGTPTVKLCDSQTP